MSLKEKLIKLEGAKVVKKIVSSSGVDFAVNNVMNKIGKATGMSTTDEYVQKIESNYLIIKSCSCSVGTITGLFINKMPDTNDLGEGYRVYDSNGNLKYKSDTLNMYDANNEKIGSVKERLISVGVPLLEKEVKRCIVYLGNERICELKKYKSFGVLQLEALEGSVEIKCINENNYKISYNGKVVANLHEVPLNFKDGYVDKFVMEYDNTEDEIIGVLLALAFDTLI